MFSDQGDKRFSILGGHAGKKIRRNEAVILYPSQITGLMLLFLYNILLPIALVVTFPIYLRRMLKREEQS